MSESRHHTTSRTTPPTSPTTPPTSPTTPPTHRLPTWRILLATIAGALCVTLAALAVHSLLASDPNGADIAHDMRGKAVEFDPNAAPPSQIAQAMNAVNDMGLRFKVPSVGLDVPLGELTMTQNTITPPGFTSAYLVRKLGVNLSNARTGTVFVAMHSLRGGGIGPGNYLINVDKGTAAVTPGETVHVGDLSYTITGSQSILKTEIGSDASIWANTPGRLVIITCMQVPAQTPSIHNIAITATLDPQN